MNKYYIVIAKCGHVGRNNHIKISFAVIASNKKEAANKTRKLPRVKHDQKDAILDVEEVSLESYLIQLSNNHKDKYLKSKSIQDQKLNCPNIFNRIILNKRIDKFDVAERKRKIYYLLRKRKIFEKQFKLNY